MTRLPPETLGSLAAGRSLFRGRLLLEVSRMGGCPEAQRTGPSYLSEAEEPPFQFPVQDTQHHAPGSRHSFLSEFLLYLR